MMKLIVDINEDIYIRLSNSDIKLTMDDIDTIRTAIRNGVTFKTWLNSFNTDSATECFNAVQKLKGDNCEEKKNFHMMIYAIYSLKILGYLKNILM